MVIKQVCWDQYVEVNRRYNSLLTRTNTNHSFLLSLTRHRQQMKRHPNDNYKPPAESSKFLQPGRIPLTTPGLNEEDAHQNHTNDLREGIESLIDRMPPLPSDARRPHRSMPHGRPYEALVRIEAALPDKQYPPSDIVSMSAEEIKRHVKCLCLIVVLRSNIH